MKGAQVLLFQLDGKIPNIALMRIAAHFRSLGKTVALRWGSYPTKEFGDDPEFVFGSAIFEKSRSSVDQLFREFPMAVVGGTGIDIGSSLEAIGISTLQQDYSVYPRWRQSIGFTQRGCRMRCSFCVVPRKEGAMRSEQSIIDLWRGDTYPRELLLLDNDFFGQPNWRERIREIQEGRFKVSFNQGINARFLTTESAEAIASIDYRDDSMKRKCIYTAWDNKKDEERLFSGLKRLTSAGVKPEHITVYMLIGYWPGETDIDWVDRQKKLRDFGARPYPMPFKRTTETVGFQRWVIGAYDKRITWQQWKVAGYRPENLSIYESRPTDQLSLQLK